MPSLKHQILFFCFSGDELMITELLFNGVFNDLTPAQCSALLSCFVFQENAGDASMKLTEQLAGPLRLLQVSLPCCITLLEVSVELNFMKLKVVSSSSLI